MQIYLFFGVRPTQIITLQLLELRCILPLHPSESAQCLRCIRAQSVLPPHPLFHFLVCLTPKPLFMLIGGLVCRGAAVFYRVKLVVTSLYRGHFLGACIERDEHCLGTATVWMIRRQHNIPADYRITRCLARQRYHHAVEPGAHNTRVPVPVDFHKVMPNILPAVSAAF